MRVDAIVVLEIKDSKEFVEVEILGAEPDSVAGVQVNAYVNGCWTGGVPGVGTHYPGSRIYSIRATYRDHCGNEACTKPYGKVRDTYAAASPPANEDTPPVKVHVHTLPPKPKPEAEGKDKDKDKGEKK